MQPLLNVRSVSLNFSETFYLTCHVFPLRYLFPRSLLFGSSRAVMCGERRADSAPSGAWARAGCGVCVCVCVCVWTAAGGLVVSRARVLSNHSGADLRDAGWWRHRREQRGCIRKKKKMKVRSKTVHLKNIYLKRNFILTTHYKLITS